MLAIILPILLAVTAPHAVENADVVVYAPKLAALSRLSGFLGPASERSVLLQPRSYAQDFHPLFAIDPFDAASLAGVGIDVTGPATVSARGSERLTCTLVKDTSTFEKRAKERLGIIGDIGTMKVGGVTLHTANLEGHPVAAYVLRGSEACAAGGNPIPAATLSELAKLPGHVNAKAQRAFAKVSGVMFVLTGQGVVGLDGKGMELSVDGSSPLHHGATGLEPVSTSAFASATPSGLFFARLKADPAALARTMVDLLGTVCHACRGAELIRSVDGIGALLTGDVLLRVDRAQSGGSLSKTSAMLNAMKFALVAEVKNPGEVKDRLAALGKLPPAHLADGKIVVPLDDGEFKASLEGRILVLSNDDSALEAIQPAVHAKSGPVAHAFEATVDPALIARGLRQISLLDIASKPELASVFAFGAEFGPLLGISDSIRLWAQPKAGDTAFHLAWSLKPAAP